MLFRALVPAILLLAACSGQTPASSDAAGETVIEVQDAFVMAPLEGRDVTAGGLKVLVTGQAVDLIGATTEAAERVELHTMAMNDGVMQMRQVESFTAAEGEPIVLERGGNHLMLFGFSPDIQSGDTVELALEFRNSDGESQTIIATADVKGLDD
ncbi:MAG: copper chaperone PCu(A)C [Hyphomonas sp.]|nr:copper chaperone PCu(A)C [Hyphomonas sp.]